MSITTENYGAVIDANGVVRKFLYSEDGAGMFLRRFEDGIWAYSAGTSPQDRVWKIIDDDFSSVREVSMQPPLKTTGLHDFRILQDGGYLLMSYEPSVRDFSGFGYSHEGFDALKTPLTETPTRDSVIQVLDADGSVRFTWNSWGSMPLEDCAQHRFPDDYAHVNSLQWTDEGILASFRGCSSVMMIDPETKTADQIVWRIGETNLADDEYLKRDLGPPPMAVVGDPEKTFCGQHAVQLISEDRLLMFDNGVACVEDPATGKTLSREGGYFSRAVEYAIDRQNSEAVFIRDHTFEGTRNRLGRVGGHAAALDSGQWLISWGYGPPSDKHSKESVTDSGIAVTAVNPDTGEYGFFIESMQGMLGPRALPVDPLALLRPAAALTAGFPQTPQQSHGGSAYPIETVVAFSRPVAQFGAETPSLAVQGASVASVRPLTAFGKSAYAWILALRPAGYETVTLEVNSRIPCDAGGICTADGTPISDAPSPIVIPFVKYAEDGNE